MGFVPPPLMPFGKEHDERVAMWQRGEITFKEVDPAFGEWLDRSDRDLKFQLWCLAIGAVGFIAVAVVAIIGGAA